MVQELTKMITERLHAYEKNMGCLPERVIVFRDGVSEARCIPATGGEGLRVQGGSFVRSLWQADA